jgi:hypothetical protein
MPRPSGCSRSGSNWQSCTTRCSIVSRKELCARGLVAKGEQIIDATIVEVPRQRNTREENATIKEGRIPEAWQDDGPKFR